ncbi:hypothetical protein HYX02_02570 [Candidatus Woesearchaeota archaeon]|nr:hypothetical protein [Candidatus Woesearchaeota archaeon]
MQQRKSSCFNSKLNICNNLKLFSKKYATYALPRVKIGNPQTNVFSECIGEALRVNERARGELSHVTGRKATPSTRFWRSPIEVFENLNLLNPIEIGGLNG